MFRKIQIFVWGLIAELEYITYPWKNTNPPQWAVDRYNVDANHHHEEYDDKISFEWLKFHEEKIAKLQLEMIYVMSKINNKE